MNSISGSHSYSARIAESGGNRSYATAVSERAARAAPRVPLGEGSIGCFDVRRARHLAVVAERRQLLALRDEGVDDVVAEEAGKDAHAVHAQRSVAVGDDRCREWRVERIDGIALEIDEVRWRRNAKHYGEVTVLAGPDTAAARSPAVASTPRYHRRAPGVHITPVRNSSRGGWRRATGAVAVVVTLALVTACGGDGDGDVEPVEAAQARVTAAEASVADAQTALVEANAAFCSEATQYVEAIDRYGRIFSDAPATVGDLTTAAEDLSAPLRSVESSAEEVTAAREELTQANEELAEANASLASAQSSVTEATTTTTLAPPLETATIDRVREAEDDLTAAAEGITAETSIREASASLNAAGYALEIAWLRLLADAGCLTEEQVAQATTVVAQYTAALQTALQTARLYDGPIDGIYGPSTVAAVEQLQTDNNLPVTGFVDEATAVALSAAVLAVDSEAATAAVAQTAAVQSVLKLAGYWAGDIDGEWTPELTEALKAFQTELGVEPTGAVDVATLHALQTAVAEAQAGADDTTTTTSPPETTAAATTVATTAAAPATTATP